MLFTIPHKLNTPLVKAGVHLISKIKDAGYDAYFVGGCVRDMLLDMSPKDIDIATNATPEQLLEIPFIKHAKAGLVGKSFGVLNITYPNGNVFEITTFRKDGEYLDHRRPETVTYGTMHDDAHRRDFTINALYASLIFKSVDDQETNKFDIIDPTNQGIADLYSGIIRTVGDPIQRFSEDGLRLLRAVRFAIRFGYRISKETSLAITTYAYLLEKIAKERVFDELTKTFISDNKFGRIGSLDLLYSLGLLEYIDLQEINCMRDVAQPKKWHPEGDVFKHTQLVLQRLEYRTPETVWAAVLHDIGKPSTAGKHKVTGEPTFYGHAELGAKMTEEILSRFPCPNKFKGTVVSIVENHMKFHELTKMNPHKTQLLLSLENIQEHIAHHKADCLASYGDIETVELAEKLLQEFKEKNNGNVLPKPLVTGTDLIALGLKPGPQFKEILDLAFQTQIKHPEYTKEQLIKRLPKHNKD